MNYAIRTATSSCNHQPYSHTTDRRTKIHFHNGFFLLFLFLFGTRNENYLVFCKVSRKFLYFFFIIYLSLFDKSAWKNTWQYTTSYIVCRTESLYTEKEKEKEKQAGSKDYALFSLRDFFFFMSPFSAFANFER